MTTIAFDGKTIAYDSRSTGVHKHDKDAEKVVKIGKTLVGSAGSYSDGYKFFRWCRDKTKERPKLDEFEAIEIFPDGKIFYYDEGCEPIPTPAPMAIGSGGKYAMGAMAAGTNAKDAVKIAMKYDEATGGKVRTRDI